MDFDRLEDLEDSGPDWSISRLHTIMQCGKKYEYKYIVKVPEEPTPPLAFGSAVHKCIDTMHMQNLWDDSQVQRLWSDTWYEYQKNIDWEKTMYRRNTYDVKGLKILETYTTKHRDDEWYAIEAHFRWQHQDIVQGWPSTPVSFRGTWDKVMRVDGRLTVIDYKTSKNPPDQALVDVDPQLTIYHRAAFETFGEDVLLGLHHLPTDQIFWTTRTDKSFNALAPMILEGISRVDEERFDRNLDYHCKWCPFKEQCFKELNEST